MKPFAIAPAVFLCCALAVLLSGTTGCNWIQEEESNRPLQPDNAVTPEDREKWYDESKGNSVKLHTRQEEDKISREVSEKVELPPVKAPDPIKVKAKDLDYKPVIEGIVPEAFAGIGEVTADFNLKNAPTVDVIPIFAQMLKFNYVVEGSLAGNITMAMHEKVTRRQLWEIFTQMLHSVGVIAEYDGKVVHIRNANAVPNQLSLAALNPNVEMGIFRFKHIPVSGVINQIKTFLLRDSRFVELAASNTLLMLDTKETVERVRMLIEHLDQPYGTNRHKLVIPCATLNPTQLVQELKEILPVLGFPVAGNNNAKDNPGLLVMQPQERLKVIIASAPNAEVLGEVARWVNVLDQPDGNQEQLYVYEIIHSRPELLIKALATMFTVSATLSSSDVNGNVTSNDNMGTPGSLMSNNKVAPGTVFDTPVRIWGDGVHNRLTIRTLPRTYAMIKAYLERIDTIPAQVLLHVLCVEVSLSDSIAFGIEFKTQTTINGWESSTGTDYKYLTPGTSSQYGIQYLLSNPENPKEFAYMNALAGQANIRVISSPQVLVINNTQATINVGDRVPIISSEVTNSSSASATSTTLVRNITYTDTGIILKVTPRITRGGRIDLKISQDISEAEVNTTSNIDSPVTSQRLLTTNMSLRDGQTIVCGGLIREKLTDNLDSLPIISTIPFVRRLLGDTNISTDRTELLVLITANIVQEDTPLQKLVKGYQQSVDSLIEFTQESYKQRVRRFQHQGDLDKWFLE